MNRFNQELNQNELTKNNIIAKLLGEDKDSNRLIILKNDNESERIGNFSTIQNLANEIDLSSEDFKVTWDDLEAINDNDNLALRVGDNGLHTFSNNGLSGLCTRLDIPSTYIKKCMGSLEFDFAAENLNFWLNKISNRNREAFVRTTDNRIHGILSNRYTVFDDHEVLDAVEGILAPRGDFAVLSQYISPELMKLRMVSRDKIVVNGDEISFGFDIKNSRVGRSSLEISIIMYRFICSNGMTLSGGKGYMFQKRHVAISREEFVTEFVEMLNEAPETVKYIRETVNKAQNMRLDDKTIQGLIDQFKANNISKHAAGRVLQMMDDKYERTMYGFVNSITELAHEYNLDTRERMEKFAGDVFLKAVI